MSARTAATGATRKDGPRTRLDRIHRTGSAVIGAGLWVFAVLGLVRRLDFFSTEGTPVLGLSSNGLLSVISVVFGAVLILAAVRGGRMASTTEMIVGALFMASGIVNVLLLDTDLNLLAFRMPNVIFSLVVGGLLLCVGAYGRFTGRLPADSPYNTDRGRSPQDAEGADGERWAEIGGNELDNSRADETAAAELAAAERAVAQHTADPALVAAVRELGGIRRPEDRIRAWASRKG
ncbi:MAG: DUF4383 domain-containing protein [Pseudonocardia sp.]|nr:DUF4383 domain-containing protein [Pseudonocardia sp.]